MMKLKLPPLPVVNVGDHVRFSLVCFGESRSATGCVLPPEHDIPNVITVEYKVALPPISEIDEVYHSAYPPNGVLGGTVQIPLEQVEEVIGKRLDLLESPPEPFSVGSWVEVSSGHAPGASGIVLGSRGQIEAIKPVANAKRPTQFKVQFEGIGAIWMAQKYLSPVAVPDLDLQLTNTTEGARPDPPKSPNAECFAAMDAEYQAAMDGTSEEFAVAPGFAINDHNWKEATGFQPSVFAVCDRIRVIATGVLGTVEKVGKARLLVRLEAGGQATFGPDELDLVLSPTLEPPPQTRPRIYTAIDQTAPPGKFAVLPKAVETPWSFEELQGAKWRWTSNGALADCNLERIAGKAQRWMMQAGPDDGLILHHVRVDRLPPEQQREWALYRVADLDRIIEELKDEENPNERQRLHAESRAEILQELQQHPPELAEGDWVELWRRESTGEPLREPGCKRGQVRSVGADRATVKFLGEAFGEFAPVWALRKLPVEPLPFEWEPVGDDLPSHGEQVWCICPANWHYGERVTIDGCSIYGAFSADEFFHFEELGRQLPDPPEQPAKPAKRRSLPQSVTRKPRSQTRKELGIPTPIPVGEFPVASPEEAALVEAHQQFVSQYWRRQFTNDVVRFSRSKNTPQNRPAAKHWSRPGAASGWIEERTGNKARKNPSISYYYCFEQSEKRQKHYIPTGKLCRVQSLLAERRPIAEILEVLVPVQ